MDVRGLMASCSEEDIMKYISQVFEKSLILMRELSRDLQRPIGKELFIVDLENFSLRDLTWPPALSLILKLTQMYEANFPEILKIGFAVNAPRTFSIAFSLLKPFLNANTQKKFRVYGKTGWKEDLLKEIDADQLPVHWGGSMIDPDGNTKCISKISAGGKVPDRYYLKNKLVKKKKRKKKKKKKKKKEEKRKKKEKKKKKKRMKIFVKVSKIILFYLKTKVKNLNLMWMKMLELY
ncbi:CRAL-TRIO domain-containing protein T23G5.2 [Armadillidium vulgare]|nr:CRAL-TRIO domain-containing protein T23G5.2 [Armadillidium vulgare]